MTKSKVIMTASAFLLAVGGVFAASFSTIEPGFEYVPTNPQGSQCVYQKDCQLEETLTPCRFISPTKNVPLFQLLAEDDCPVVLYEIEQ